MHAVKAGLPEWSPLLDSALMAGSQIYQDGSEWKWQTLQLIAIRQQLRP